MHDVDMCVEEDISCNMERDITVTEFFLAFMRSVGKNFFKERKKALYFDYN